VNGRINQKIMKHYDITISGRVHGVGFRYVARTIAKNSGIYGFIKNLYDGKVYIEIEGEEEKLKEFIKWCHSGPAHAKVDNVITEQSELKNFNDFEIRL